MPRLENTIKYIMSELDEMDREEFFRFVLSHSMCLSWELMGCCTRLKKVQGKKKRDNAIKEAEKRAIEAQGHQNDLPEELLNDDTTGGGDLLGTKDEDVIF